MAGRPQTGQGRNGTELGKAGDPHERAISVPVGLEDTEQDGASDPLSGACLVGGDLLIWLFG